MTPTVEINADGSVRVRTGKVELGQGLHSALAQIVADALGVPPDRVEMLSVDTDHSPDQGVTSGSLSVHDAGHALREACAVLIAQTGERSREGVAPGEGPLWVGQSLARRDLPRLLAGQPHFIHDLTKPGLLHGRVLHPPRLGGELTAWDEAAARRSAGLLQLQRDGQLLGLLAASNAQADAALRVLEGSARWSLPPEQPDSADDLQRLPAITREVARHPIRPAPPEGDKGREAAISGRRLRARYTKPWIAHASLAPSCALACWQGDTLHVWTHSQGIFNLRRDLALAFGIAPAAVRVTHAPGAGCYGHNGADDAAFDAAWLARAVPGQTVRLVWRHADELTQSPMGPAMVVELQAGLDAAGRIMDWQHDVWSPGHSRRPGRSATPALLGAWQVAAAHAAPASIDMPLANGGGAERNAVPGYDFAAWQVNVHSVITARRSSALRSLGAFANVFAAESFIDEIAHATGDCPLALRRRHLQHDPRALAVLDAAAQRAGYVGRSGHASASTPKATPLPEGWGLGIAVARYKGNGAWCAVVAQVLAGERLRVQRLTIAVDVGLAVNPDGVANQIEGGAIQATSWALLESAAPAHAGWDDYPILRFTDVPAVEVLVLPSTAPSLGAGEASLGPTAAAIANALFNALGLRVRDLPLTPGRIIAAMEAAAP